MESKRLGTRQLLNMKRGTLEKRVVKNYEETKDQASLVEYAVAIMIRNALILEDFSCLFHELLREVFLTSVPCETMRRFLPLFEALFSQNDWQQVIQRLFATEKDYYEATKEARLYKDCLKDKNPTRRDALASHSFVLHMFFKDERGKKHAWVLKNAHPTRDMEDIRGALQLLTMLTIFETNGIRKFTEVLDFDRYGQVVDLQYRASEEDTSEDTSPEEPEKKKIERAKDTAKSRTVPTLGQAEKSSLPVDKQVELKQKREKSNPLNNQSKTSDQFLIIQRTHQPDTYIPIPNGKKRNQLTYDEIQRIRDEYFANVEEKKREKVAIGTASAEELEKWTKGAEKKTRRSLFERFFN